MDNTRLKIMLVESNLGDARQLRDALAEDRDFEHQLDHFMTLGDALVGLRDWPPAIILLDLTLPDAQGLTTVQRMTNAAPTLPIIILTGPRDERVAVEMVGAGVQDYLVKGQVSGKLLIRAIRYAIERKHAQVELGHKNAELTALNEQKNQLLGMAVHDLRNPLSVIITYCDFLLGGSSGSLSPDQQRFLSAMKRSSEFMLNFVTDLLDVAGLESGKVRLKLESTNLAELAEQNIGVNRVLAERKGVELRFEHPSDLSPVMLDRAKIEQVLNSLIGNAVKYSPPGTHSTVSLDRNNGHVEIAVADQGPGIPALELDRLFRPFDRTSVRGSKGEKDAGLGLAIVKRIVESHHGTIRVESAVGQGTTFRVDLPANAPVSNAA